MLSTRAEQEHYARLDLVERRLVAELREVARAKAALDAVRTGRARARAATIAAAATKLFRDGSPKDRPGHREVARRYAWCASATKPEASPAAGETGGNRLITLIRLRELERLFRFRYGTELPDDDAGHDDLKIVAQHIVHLGPDAERHIVQWAQLWAPWLSTAEATALAIRSIANPIKFSADTLAWRLHLTAAERKQLAITTIGAVDMNKAQRTEARKERRRETDRARRRASGARSRAEYEAPSAEAWRPWEAEGISRATWYRRRKAKGGSAGEREHVERPPPPQGGAVARIQTNEASKSAVRQVRGQQVSCSNMGGRGRVSPAPCGPTTAPATTGASVVSSGAELARMRGATAPPAASRDNTRSDAGSGVKVDDPSSRFLPISTPSSHVAALRPRAEREVTPQGGDASACKVREPDHCGEILRSDHDAQRCRARRLVGIAAASVVAGPSDVAEASDRETSEKFLVAPGRDRYT
ncbi:hypothetical protein [Rhodovulum sp. PH10]|uniref:hypothetical protein n=1 Tax=Rhodovulum sp. PH10 TaxID=1187851 RepID=UPI0012FB6DDE|nr:hypothetical protein [Rhodovulum sp. PH10]